MANKLPDDVKKRAEAKCADRPHLEIQDPGTVWISPSGKVFVFVVDTNARHPAVCRPVRNGCGESSGRVPPDAPRHTGGAQAPVSRHVPEGVAPVWQHAGILDAVAGSLRPKEG